MRCDAIRSGYRIGASDQTRRLALLDGLSTFRRRAQLLSPLWLLMRLSEAAVISSPVKVSIDISVAIPNLAGSSCARINSLALINCVNHRCPCQILVDNVVLGEDSLHY
jgi:hypothetical protein